MLRQLTELIFRYGLFKQLFLIFGFVTVRFIWPLQYFLLKELSDCDSVLDLGCGKHSMVPIIPQRIYKVGVEISESSYEAAVKSRRHHKYSNQDIRDVTASDREYDAVCLLDVIEHLSKPDALILLEKMNRWAKKKVIVFTPNGFLEQEGTEDNDHMEHLSGWTVKDFEELGFKVYGVRGFKQLKQIRPPNTPRWLNGLIDFTQLITYFFPNQAFQLFCVKSVQD